jgi:glycerate 2-kinase
MTTAHSDRRALLRAMFDAAVRAAHPDHALTRHFPPLPKGRVIVLAAGKGAAAMAAAAERHYLDTLGLSPARFGGIATTRHGHGHPTRQIKVVEAGHPVPDAASVAAATETLAMAQQATADDLVLVLLSGGGSANWVAPADGLSLVEKQTLTRALLRSGAPIGAINCVRKHLSKIKGGRLARAAWPAKVVTLAVSDVPGDDPSVIASGPTVADPTTLIDAQRVLKEFGVTSPAATAALDDVRNESPKPGNAAFASSDFSIVATPRAALAAAARMAEDAGYEVIDLGSNLEGEAREIAANHAAMAKEAKAAGRRVAILSGGELTVTLRGNGRGGPNQEYALALLAQLNDLASIHALAADTDGADGGAGSPSDPAGAFVDAQTAAQSLRLGLDAADFLTRNDATGFFERTGGLLVTGPTLTNVNDLRAILIEPA